MKSAFALRTAAIAVFILSAGALIAYMNSATRPAPAPLKPRPAVRSTRSPYAGIERKIARDRYFFRMLRDPATRAMPPDIRRRELAYARTLPQYHDIGGMRPVFGKPTAGVPGFDWQEVGPFDVGGRTRALAVDLTDTNTIITGGVSGGIWKSTDGGATWALKTGMTDPLSVTWVAQDPRSGHTDTWYYVTGEFRGNSASDFSGLAGFFGAGIFKSTDNGESWLFLTSTADVDPTVQDTPFDFLSKVVVSPTTGTVFVASNGFGILRSADEGASFQLVLGGPAAHQWSDVAVTPDGKVVATLSSTSGGGVQLTRPGVYRSTDDGVNWTDITPVSFPPDHERSVIGAAPSNPDAAYILTFTGNGVGASEEVVFHKISSIKDGIFSERSANLPDFGAPLGHFDTQLNYNMLVAVKPDDEDFVFIAGTNLFRSRDGFLTKNETEDETWVGGYNTANDGTLFPNQHPDQHVVVFNPQNPNVMWAGHDGGVSRAPDVTAAPMTWEDKNGGYNVTQFYTAALPAAAGDTRVVGGAQDNGSPFFDWSRPADASIDLSTGDGGFAYFGQQFLYASAQEGRVLRVDPSDTSRSLINPTGVGGQLFIHPFAVDPSDENVMYYPAGDHFWRNDSLSSIPDNENTTRTGWKELTSVGVDIGAIITAVAVSTTNPSHRLYFASFDDENTPPKLLRLDLADVATDGEEDISIPSVPAGAYIHGIAVNPNDGKEILVVLSNYNIIGLYHSMDGGQNYTAVEGNLEGTNSNGPSIRWASILPRTVTQYLVGTSVGLFSTVTLDGNSTVWLQEGGDVLGNVVTSAVASRPSDGTVAVGTHGRGIFIGTERSITTSVASDTGTVVFDAGNGAQTTVAFQSGAVAGASVFYQNHGTSPPSSRVGEPPPSIPVQFFTLTSTIPDSTAFQAKITVTYTDAQLSDAGITDESSLVLFRFDTADSSWRQLSTILDTDANTAMTVTSAFSTWALAAVNPTGIEDTETGQGRPRAFSLNQNFPNPFNPATTIRYTVPKQASVRLTIYNVAGQHVRTLVEKEQPAGTYSVVWNGRNDRGRAVSSGVYLYRLTAGAFHANKRMTLLK